MLTGDRGSPKRTRARADEQNLKLLLAFVLRRQSNCLDVGANRGHILRDMCRLAPAGRHLAYEPLPHLCAKLLQRFPEVDVRQRALSNESGETTFVHVQKLEAYSGLKERRYPHDVETETIPVITERLDDHLPDGWLPDFVKIDVEGATGLVLQGAVDTLRKAKPVMTFEHGRHAERVYGIPDEDIYTLLCSDVGLRLFDMDGNGPLDLPQFKDGLATQWNWVAHE
jgi:FkbM family methyltransferase